MVIEQFAAAARAGGTRPRRRAAHCARASRPRQPHHRVAPAVVQGGKGTSSPSPRPLCAVRQGRRGTGRPFKWSMSTWERHHGAARSRTGEPSCPAALAEVIVRPLGGCSSTSRLVEHEDREAERSDDCFPGVRNFPWRDHGSLIISPRAVRQRAVSFWVTSVRLPRLSTRFDACSWPLQARAEDLRPSSVARRGA